MDNNKEKAHHVMGFFFGRPFLGMVAEANILCL